MISAALMVAAIYVIVWNANYLALVASRSRLHDASIRTLDEALYSAIWGRQIVYEGWFPLVRTPWLVVIFERAYLSLFAEIALVLTGTGATHARSSLVCSASRFLLCVRTPRFRRMARRRAVYRLSLLYQRHLFRAQFTRDHGVFACRLFCDPFGGQPVTGFGYFVGVPSLHVAMAVLLQFAIRQSARAAGGVARGANQPSDDCEHLRPRVSLPGGCAWWRAAGVDRNRSLASTIIEGAAGTEGLTRPASASAAVPLSAASYPGSLLVDRPNCRQGISRETGGLFFAGSSNPQQKRLGPEPHVGGALAEDARAVVIEDENCPSPMIARPGRPWPASVPPVLMAALALLLLLGLATPPDPRAIAARTRKRHRRPDAFPRCRLRGSLTAEAYYPTMRDELVARGYPTGSVVNWRTPLHLELVARAPIALRGLLLLVAVLVLIGTALSLRNVSTGACVAGLLLQGPPS